MNVETVCLVAAGLMAFIVPLVSGLEAVVAHTNRARIRQLAEEEQDKRAQALDSLLEERPRLLSAFSILHSMSTLLCAMAATIGILLLAPGEPAYIGLLALVLALWFLIAESAVRRLGAARAESTALALVKVLKLVDKVLQVPIRAVHRIVRPILQNGTDAPEEGPPRVKSEDIRLMVQEGHDLQAEEKEMIHSIFEFRETIVREIMVPRVDMVCIEANAPVSRVLDLAVTRGLTRFPCYEGTIDNILGIINTKDLLVLLKDQKFDTPLREVVRPALFVPGSKPVDQLLREMQRERHALAIVVDEYGGTDGLITMEDIIEEIVGDITDEYDRVSIDVEHQQDGSVLVDARMLIEDVNELLEVEIPSDDYETIGGYVYGKLGRIPSQGESVEVNGVTITVERVQRQRITQVRMAGLIRPVVESATTTRG